MRFFISLVFLLVVGAVAGFMAIAMLDMPPPTKQIEIILDNSALVGKDG